MPVFPHSCAIRLQQSRSTAVIAAPGMVHAITGSAASSSAKAETPTLTASLTTVSLFLTVVRGNGSKKVSNYPSFVARALVRYRLY